MSDPMPANAPELIRDQAELDMARFCLPRFVRQHDARATGPCLCPLCRMVRPFLAPPSDEPVRYGAWVNENEVPS